MRIHGLPNTNHKINQSNSRNDINPLIPAHVVSITDIQNLLSTTNILGLKDYEKIMSICRERIHSLHFTELKEKMYKSLLFFLQNEFHKLPDKVQSGLSSEQKNLLQTELIQFLNYVDVEDISVNVELDAFHEFEITVNYNNHKLSFSYTNERNTSYEIISVSKVIGIDNYLTLRPPFTSRSWKKVQETFGFKYVNFTILAMFINKMFSIFKSFDHDIDWIDNESTCSFDFDHP